MASPAEKGGLAAAGAYEDSVFALLRPRLELIISRLTKSGTSLPDPAELAEAMATAVPSVTTRSEYDTLVGPFYSSVAVMRMLSIPTKQALDDRRRRGTVLAARTSDGVWVYPAFQFDTANRRVRAELVSVLSALKKAPRWGAALWLVTPQPDLSNRPPLEASVDPDVHDRVVAMAAEYAQLVNA